MRDLIRNYKMTIKRQNESDSDMESQPLVSSNSSSSSPPKQSFGSFHEPCVFKHESEDSEGTTTQLPQMTSPIPPVLLQKKLNRKMLFPSSYETPELEVFENIYDRYENNCKISSDVLEQKRKPSDTFDYKTPESAETNSSLVTIFAIWNTTVGTSLLAMSWGIEKTGLFPAIFINIVIAAICLYTCAVLLRINEKHGVIGCNWEVGDLCRALLGRWAEILAKIFSMIVLIGANVVYWILMSNFFYNFVHFLYGSVFHPNNATGAASSSSAAALKVLCPKNDTIILLPVNATAATAPPPLTPFEQFWDLYSTVPIVLALLMFPMLNWKSPTFFTKFNSLGTLSVLYLIVFVASKAIRWGVNVPDWTAEFKLKPTFCALSGMLSLSYFIHNIIISIMRNNKRQEHNKRDLTIAFGLITFTYLFIGVVFYIAFPLPKFCIEDNILNNFDEFDLLTIMARLLLLFQLFTVFPLISFMLRNDVLSNINALFKNHRFGDFTYGRVITLNLGILTVCILFACFLPRIGTLIRYTGALSGMVHIFMLPSLLKIASLKKDGTLTATQLAVHVAVLVGGGLNLISQFFISD